MLTDILKNGLISEKRYNCAEKIIIGANQAYGLGLDENALKLSGGFGGGMQTGATCGALCGGMMALSALYSDDYAHQSAQLKPLVKEFLDKYNTKMQSTECRTLKPKFGDPDKGCYDIILEAAKILDEIVKREGKQHEQN